MVIFNYYYYHEFCVFGWCARLCLIITSIASFVVFSGGVRGYFFNYYYYCDLCFPGWCAWLIFKYYYYCEFCFSGWRVRLFFK